MSLFRSTRQAQPARRFVPRFEAMESRDCPAVSASVVGHTLLVIGDGSANTVVVSDNGDGNVSATIDSASASGSGINKVVVKTKGGDDAVSYKLNGALTVSESLFIELGKGTDSANLDFKAGVNAGKLKVSVEGNGPDTIGASFGSIAAGASVAAEIEGGHGDNNITTTFAGALNGILSLSAEGGDGNDTITTNVSIDAGSTGKLSAKVEGGDGTNNLTLNVTDNTATGGKTGLKSLKAKIEAHAGDTVTNTSNVKVEIER